MRASQAGVTLLELMIVVTIVGILAAIAYPSYRNQVIRSNRAEAKIALEQRAQALEKCFTRYMQYNHAQCAAGQAAANRLTPDGHYMVTLTAINATSFVIQAAPQGGQATDAECMNFTISEAGLRSISGSGSTARCW